MVVIWKRTGEFAIKMEREKSGDYRTLKYYEQLNSYKYAEVNNMIVPMFRMSEVYYIAAEAIYKRSGQSERTI